MNVFKKIGVALSEFYDDHFRHHSEPVEDFALAERMRKTGRAYGELGDIALAKADKDEYAREVAAQCIDNAGIEEKLSKVYSSHAIRTQQKLNQHHAAGIITIFLGLISGAYFLSPNFTGNIISEVPAKYTNIVGIILVVLGLIALFFLLRNKK